MKITALSLTFLLLLPTLLPAQSTPEIHISVFEAGHISTEAVEYACAFNPAGTEVYFARSNDKWASGKMKSAIFRSIQQDGNWSTPEVASFSGEFDDSDPHLTRDGKRLYFISDRPAEGVEQSADIWVVEKDKAGQWGKPTRLHAPLNSAQREYSPRTDAQGNLYFASDRPGGYGQGDLYVAHFENGQFNAPLNMGSTLNAETGEWNLEVNGQGDLIIFEASQRPQNITGYGDLYISFRTGDTWSVPQHLEELNTSGSDLYPHLTRDEQSLFYSSSDSLKGTDTNLYHTDFRPLYEKYKGKAVFSK